MRALHFERFGHWIQSLSFLEEWVVTLARMRSDGLQYLVCRCVLCLSEGYKAAYDNYQQLQNLDSQKMRCFTSNDCVGEM